MPDIRSALVSVSDKSGLPELVACLAAAGVRILSTGGTAKAIRECGVPVREISDHTGEEEILGGRVKTLHPKVFGGILADLGRGEHRETLAAKGIEPIGLVAVNFYPFASAVARNEPVEEAIEKIDVGGPSLVRAAAKNHAHVAVLADPADYPDFVRHLGENCGKVSPGFARRLAAKAFAMTGRYDAMIAAHLGSGEKGAGFPPAVDLHLEKAGDLRYGENPHQAAAIYRDGRGEARATHLSGPALSYNNHLDLDAAWECASAFPPGECCCVIVKHGSPCGVAIGTAPGEAFRRAREADPESAFGGVIATGAEVDGGMAREIASGFFELLCAPAFSGDALEILRERQSLRVVRTDPSPFQAWQLRSVVGGLLAQERDRPRVSEGDLRRAGAKEPTAGEIADLLFAWQVAKHAKSNAIVIARDRCTLGIGAGQTSRVESARIACARAATHGGAKGAVAASDGFLPFPDTLSVLADAGVVALVQPGGSKRDAEVVAEADRRGMAMMHTGVRHFRH